MENKQPNITFDVFQQLTVFLTFDSNYHDITLTTKEMIKVLLFI